MKEEWKTIVDFPDYAVSKMFNVTRPNITSINCGKTWKEVVYDHESK